ncbi:putative proline-rich receptor-like protein kinase PERK3 [Iris pallida]|uniref:Proline-rich receptor-like protein kinase PERK3 n=1 Tax=Iris pallida TaxID=29817 RepID=A0AAX6DVD9_IRIPA|nr:putative proline-rich receptor-like protein kinase PERK3 [Iris pallida]
MGHGRTGPDTTVMVNTDTSTTFVYWLCWWFLGMIIEGEVVARMKEAAAWIIADGWGGSRGIVRLGHGCAAMAWEGECCYDIESLFRSSRCTWSRLIYIEFRVYSYYI